MTLAFSQDAFWSLLQTWASCRQRSFFLFFGKCSAAVSLLTAHDGWSSVLYLFRCSLGNNHSHKHTYISKYNVRIKINTSFISSQKFKKAIRSWHFDLLGDIKKKCYFSDWGFFFLNLHLLYLVLIFSMSHLIAASQEPLWSESKLCSSSEVPG